MALGTVGTSRLRWPTTGGRTWLTGKKAKATSSTSGTVDAANRFDIDYIGALARELAPKPPISDVTWRRRAGGSVDVYFVVDDKEAGYVAAAPVIRALLEASALSLDFHVMGPGDVLLEE